MDYVAVALGIFILIFVLADMTNTMISLRTSRSKWWLTFRFYRGSWRLLKRAAMRNNNVHRREHFMAVFAPASLLLLLMIWLSLQILGFALIWWGTDSLSGGSGLWNAVYFSGVVFFTVGFGDVVPDGGLSQFAAVAEALMGVLTVALVIAYLPGLIAAFGRRELRVVTLDDGGDGPVTPMGLVLARAPDRSAAEMFDYFESWEQWVADAAESLSTYPMIIFFRSRHAGQNWLTALNLVTDAALICQTMVDGHNRNPYFLIRRTTYFVQIITSEADLSQYELDFADSAEEYLRVFNERYDRLETAGFNLLPRDQALEIVRDLRSAYTPGLAYLIHQLAAPVEFWSQGEGFRPSTACIVD
ncbi:MAG: potassium channel family protein [Acidimicrobiales bacterium]